MKTLHEIRGTLSFLEYMQLRFQGNHRDWHYRGDEVWFRNTDTPDGELTILRDGSADFWHRNYDLWVADGADPERIRQYFT